MRILVTIIGVLLILMGIIWFLQGINILPGSFMTGQLKWAVFGVIGIIVGGILLFSVNRKKPRPPADRPS